MILLRRPTASSLIGSLVLVLAATVAGSLIAGQGFVLQGDPGTAMVFSTALCLGLVALALAGEWVLSAHAHRQFQQLVGSVVALIGVLALLGHLTDLPLNIDWASLHHSSAFDDPHPGRMSIPTAAMLVVAGAALLLMNRVNALWRGLAVQALTTLLIAVGVIGVVGWTLGLHLAYQDYLFGRISLLAALGFVLVGTALWTDWRRMDWYRSRTLIADEGLRISLSASALLASMLAIAVVAGFGIIAPELHASARGNLLESLERRVDRFRSSIDLRSAQAQMIATSPAHVALLRNLQAQPNDAKSVVQLAAAAESLLPHGFSGIAFQNRAGRTWVEAGRFAVKPERELALGDRQAILLWDDGFVLQFRLPLMHGNTAVGSLLAEQPMRRLTAALEYTYDFAARGTVAVCGRRENALQCYPQGAQGRAFSMPYSATLPIARAIRGETGAMLLRDARGVNAIAAFAPIGTLDLGLVLQMDAAELYAPLRRQMYLVIALLGGAVLLGALVLQWRIAPLARRLFLHEQRLKLALDSSRSAVWDLDLKTGQVYLSEQWPALLGGEPQPSSRSLEELFRLLHPDDVAMVRRSLRAALSRDALPYEVEHRVRAPTGDWTWIHSAGTVIERDHRGKALRMIGINTNIARRKQAQSFIERRASRDEATGLPNRAVFTDRLQTAMARSRRAPPDRSLMAVLFVSIEAVKGIDEAMGRDAARSLLKEVTQRLQSCVRATDTLARIGVDEFAIILEELGLTQQACGIADKLISELQPELAVHRAVPTMSANIGISFYDGVIKVTAEAMVAKAQSAMHQARDDAPNNYRVAAW